MRPVRLLLLGFYYPPDISAGAFRAQALVQALENRLPEGSELHVLTTMPNRFARESQRTAEEERLAGGKVTITRLPVPKGGSGMAGQAWAFLHYAFRVARHARGQQYDLVVASSSRLMTAVLGRWVARRRNAKLYQDIRDIFVDNLPHVLPLGGGHFLAPPFSILERWSLRSADCINLVSPGFASYFMPRYPRQRFTWHTNGIDTLFVEAAEQGRFDKNAEEGTEPRLKVLYAGNLGAGQGLEHILPPLAARLGDSVHFTVIGAGGGQGELQRRLETQRAKNVTLLPPLPREHLLDAYREADVLFLHLNDLPSLARVLPSKLFEYAATGKPIWAGVSGYAASFVEREIENAVVFPPCDTENAVAALGQLALSSRPRAPFVAKWRRDRIMGEMAGEIMALVTDEA